LPAQREPELAARPEAKAPAAEASQAARTAQPATQIDPSFDDDQLEIPAFLRRQAN